MRNPDSLSQILSGVRGQFNAFYRDMSLGGEWNLYRVPGTDRFVLLRSDARMDVPLELAIGNVQAMTADRLCLGVLTIVRG